MSDDQSRALGYRNGDQARRHPTACRCGATAPPRFSQSLYYRGIWAALALLIGLGSVSLAVFSGGEITLAHIVIPALLCVVGTLFALWQILLVVHGRPARHADRSSPCRPQSPLPPSSLIGSLLYDRAVPALTELWNIHNGDAALGDLAVTASPDGTHPLRLGRLWHAQRGGGAQGAGAAQVDPRGRARRGRADAPRWASRSSA